MTSNVVLIGKIADYQSNFNLILSQVQEKVLNVVAVVLEKSNYKSIDNIPVYSSLSEVKKLDFDYFILLTENQEYYTVLSDENNFKQRIIPVRVFSLPYFNFSKYQQLIDNPPSIISRHCWGGIVYHSLGLPFNSPFINLFLNEADFNKLVGNFKHYMNEPLEFLQEGYDPILESNYPIVKLDDITIYFNHYSTFEEAQKKWNERKKRINYDNLFFETTTEFKSVATQFNSLNLQHKLCFCLDDFENQYMINCMDLIPNYSKGKLGMFVNGIASGEIPYFDLVELLLNNNLKPRIDVYKKDNIERLYNYYKTTQLYEVEYNRFFGLDVEVPWNLEDKKTAYHLAENLNIPHPKIYYELDKIARIKTINKTDLPEKFYLKQSNKTDNSMLLKKSGQNFIDLFTSKEYTIKGIIDKIKVNDNTLNQMDAYYLIEEVTDTFINSEIPLEYKVISFNGIPKIIMQINKSNNKIFLFDGNFIPLKEGRDWYLNTHENKLAIPLIPPSAYKIISNSIKIAQEADNKLVITTWYDNGNEAIFDGLTFASNEIFEGKIALSREIILNMINSLNQVLYTDYIEKGYRINSEKLQKSLNIELNYITDEYKNTLQKCLMADQDALNDMTSYFEKLSINEKNADKKRLYQHLEIAWLEILLLSDNLFTEKICRQVKAGWGFVFLKTFYYQQRINESKEILIDKSKSSDWYKIRWAQFILDMGGSQDEVTKAKKYIENFSKEGINYALNVKEKYGL